MLHCRRVFVYVLTSKAKLQELQASGKRELPAAVAEQALRSRR
jgi:hypothetical protein